MCIRDSGDGDGKPIGLSRTLTGTVAGNKTTYAEKAVETAKLTFVDSATVVKELTNVYKYHSVKSDGNPVAVEGNVVMVVNPTDAWDVKKPVSYTHLIGQNTQKNSSKKPGLVGCSIVRGLRLRRWENDY